MTMRLMRNLSFRMVMPISFLLCVGIAHCLWRYKCYFLEVHHMPILCSLTYLLLIEILGSFLAQRVLVTMVDESRTSAFCSECGLRLLPGPVTEDRAGKALNQTKNYMQEESNFFYFVIRWTLAERWTRFRNAYPIEGCWRYGTYVCNWSRLELTWLPS